MAEQDKPKRDASQESAELKKFSRQVEKKERRKMSVRKHGKESVWFGLGMFGLVGWSVAIPTLIGIAFGIWLDKHWQQGQVSWTLTFLVVGIFLGCLNAWYWIVRERDAIYKHTDERKKENRNDQ